MNGPEQHEYSVVAVAITLVDPNNYEHEDLRRASFESCIDMTEITAKRGCYVGKTEANRFEIADKHQRLVMAPWLDQIHVDTDDTQDK